MTYLQEEVHEKLGLDRYCLRILRLMLVKGVFKSHPMRFNKLFHLVQTSGVREKGMSKPTFNDHLGHLVKRSYVQRKRKGKQNVVYFLRTENLQITEAKETVENILRTHEMMSEKHRSMTVDELAKAIADFSAFINLDQTRILIEDVLKLSKDRFDHVLAFSLNQAYINKLYFEMLTKCVSDKNACKWALRVLDKAMALKREDLSKQFGVAD